MIADAAATTGRGHPLSRRMRASVALGNNGSERRNDHPEQRKGEQDRGRDAAQQRLLGAVGLVEPPGQQAQHHGAAAEHPGEQPELLTDRDQADDAGDAEQQRKDEPPMRAPASASGCATACALP